MQRIWCPVCQKHEDIYTYDHDDPVLFCGHTKQISDGDLKETDEVYKTIRDEVYRIMRDHNVSYEEAKEILWEDD